MDTPSVRESVRQEFDKIASAYGPIRASTGGRDVREFVRWIQPRPRDCVLDAACGPATLARRLIRNVRRVYGVDLCERMIQLGASPATSGAQPLLTVGDVEQLPYASKSFQLVVCAYAFPNFPEPLRALREFVRVLDDKGRIALLDVIAPADPMSASRLNLIEGLRGDCYTRILDCFQFTELFREAGLRLESAEFHHRHQSWHDWLRLSPAATDPKRARRLRETLLESSAHVTGPITRHADGEIVLRYEIAWFLLRRFTAPVESRSSLTRRARE